MLRLNGYWYIAAPSSELKKKPIRREVEGETLVLFRDSHGQPQALFDRCAHRGMALSRGKVIQDCVECPYHGWQYNGQGKVCAVPALCDTEPLPEPRTMRAFPACEQDQHIWIWLGQEAPVKPPFHFPNCGEPGWTTFFMATRFEAPVEACLENFLDVPHTLLVHPGLFRGNKQKRTSTRVSRGSDWAEVEFLDEKPLEGWGPRMVFPRSTVMKHTDRFILPSITHVTYSFGEEYAFTITSQCTQREEFLVDVTTAITWKLPLPKWLALPFLRRYCRRVIQQDVEILKVQGEQIRRFGRTFVSTSADMLGPHIWHLRQQAAKGHGAEQNGKVEVYPETIIKI